MMKQSILAGVAAIALIGCGGGDTTNSTAANEAPASSSSRNQILIVGSSTVYPFATTVAESFGRSTDFKTPIVESTGSGGGFKLFCGGVGDSHPDFTNASRRIKASEIEKCAENGVDGIVEMKVGYDGIVLARSNEAEPMTLSTKDIFLALAKDVPDGNGGFKENDYVTWQDVNPELPALKIEVLGPPPTSGTRDAFVELAMEGGCKQIDMIAALKKSDGDAYKARCHSMREDGAFIEAGENDNLIVQKLRANPDALGIFGYSFLEQNSGVVTGSLVNGVSPTFEAISSGDYPVSRSLYVYAKTAHIGVIPGMEEFVAEFMANKTIGGEGYLTDKGLIPMGAAELAERQASVAARKTVILD